MRLVIRWIVMIAALFAAVYLVPGISVSGSNALLVVAVTAVILGFVNAIIRPVLKFLSCPLVLLTLGLFSLVINAWMLWLSSTIAQRWFHIGFVVGGFWPAFFGAIVVSVVSFLLNMFVKDEE